ncbi:MAG: hypothetical protein ABJ327_10350 [Litoreibacter sp.]
MRRGSFRGSVISGTGKLRHDRRNRSGVLHLALVLSEAAGAADRRRSYVRTNPLFPLVGFFTPELFERSSNSDDTVNFGMIEPVKLGTLVSRV